MWATVMFRDDTFMETVIIRKKCNVVKCKKYIYVKGRCAKRKKYTCEYAKTFNI